ncbi:MAG: hypothetical protein WCY10_03090 [Candidatus Omnitrophota bacterium]|jgi:hypothetical protein
MVNKTAAYARIGASAGDFKACESGVEQGFIPRNTYQLTDDPAFQLKYAYDKRPGIIGRFRCKHGSIGERGYLCATR